MNEEEKIQATLLIGFKSIFNVISHIKDTFDEGQILGTHIQVACKIHEVEGLLSTGVAVEDWLP